MTTIRISDEVEEYIKKYGKFGETHDDVLRKCLSNFDELVNTDLAKIKEQYPLGSKMEMDWWSKNGKKEMRVVGYKKHTDPESQKDILCLIASYINEKDEKKNPFIKNRDEDFVLIRCEHPRTANYFGTCNRFGEKTSLQVQDV